MAPLDGVRTAAAKEGARPASVSVGVDGSGLDRRSICSADVVLSASTATADSDEASEVYDAIEEASEGSSVSSSDAAECAGRGRRAGPLQRVLSSDAILVRGLALAPVPMTPLRLSRATEIQLFLERVEFIEIRDVVTRDEDVVYYVLDVFLYQQQKGIPSRRRPASATPAPLAAESAPALVPPSPLQPDHRGQERRPDYQIEQRYSSFARLRRNVASIARRRHPHGRACTYCQSLLSFLRTASAKPCLKVKFGSSVDERKEILGAFISDLVYAAREGHAGCARSRRGYHLIPALVRRFLAEQTGANFFRY